MYRKCSANVSEMYHLSSHFLSQDNDLYQNVEVKGKGSGLLSACSKSAILISEIAKQKCKFYGSINALLLVSFIVISRIHPNTKYTNIALGKTSNPL